jgi:hypothetical protein
MIIGYARCRETITSPAPSPGAQAMGLRPNMRCNILVPIMAMGPQGVLCQCAVGHHIHVTERDLIPIDELAQALKREPS